MSELSLNTPIASPTGKLAPDWLLRFPELDPHRVTLAKFKSVQALAKSYAMLETRMSNLAVKNTELRNELGEARNLLGALHLTAPQTNDDHENN